MFFQETKGNTKKAILKWELHNVTSLEWQTKKRGEVVTSSEFHAVDDNQVKWCIQLFPNGKAVDDKGWVSAFISPRIAPTYQHKINAEICFAVYDKDRREIFGGIMEATFGPHEPYKKSQGWSKIAKLADVLKDDFFWIIFMIDYADPNPPTKVSVPSSSNEEPTTSLSQDIIEQLFNNRLGTDVCFIIEEKEIRAHKAILLARSPVFAAMLESSGMKESIENRVEINDIAPDIFEALLRFFYTDRVDLAQVDVQDLLAAAYKYMISLLKLECQKNLSERLTIENCAEMLALADLHNCVHLKRSALHFIRLYRGGVMQSDGWKDLKQSRPDLAFYVLENLL